MTVFKLLLLTLFSQDSILVEQGQVAVPLSDLDAYVHNLPPEKRYGFVEEPGQVEKNILTLLNMNFIHRYLQDTKLIEVDEFASAISAIEAVELVVDQRFADKLELDKVKFLQNLKFYALKNEYFMRLNIYFQQEMLKGTVQSLAYDQFISEKKKYKRDEKRRLSVIQLDKKNHTQKDSIAVLKNIIDGDDINDLALKLSVDPSVSLNKGDWSFYSHKQFKYGFSDEVFAVKQLGIIPTVFETEKYYFLVSVEEISPEAEADFENHKKRLIDELLPVLAKRKIQNIINEYSSKSDIQINKEAVSQAYQRYLVFEEDSK